MALVNNVKREINAKIVYFGPPGAGKTSCLNFIFRKLKAEYRSQQKSMALQQDQMLFFDFMPPGQSVSGEFDVRFHVYTLSGTVCDESSWKMLLKGVDGIVFVADSTPDRLSANQQSMDQLLGLLGQYQRGVRDLPCILQCNKSDVQSALTPEEIGATLEWRDLPVIASSANKGMGVLEGLFRIVKMAMQDLRANVLTQEESAVRDGQMGQAQNITSSSVYHAAVASVSVSERTSSPPDFAIATEPPDISAAIAEVAVSMAGQPIARTGGEVVIPITVDVGETHLDLELVLTIAVNREKVGSV